MIYFLISRTQLSSNSTMKYPINSSPSLPSSMPQQHNMTSEAEFASRLSRVKDVCSKGEVKGNIQGIFTFPEAKVLYCFVPKAGCTFWKRIFVLSQRKVRCVRVYIVMCYYNNTLGKNIVMVVFKYFKKFINNEEYLGIQLL